MFNIVRVDICQTSISILISYVLNIWYELFDMLSRTKVKFSIGGEIFCCIGQHVMVKGFASIMPWLAVNEKNLPQFKKGEKIEVSKVELYEVMF